MCMEVADGWGVSTYFVIRGTLVRMGLVFSTRASAVGGTSAGVVAGVETFGGMVASLEAGWAGVARVSLAVSLWAAEAAADMVGGFIAGSMGGDSLVAGTME
jgi:hypothetical protein